MDTIAVMPIRGFKRKASEYEWQNTKQLRAGEAALELDERGLTIIHAEDTQSSESDNEIETDKSATTPLTSQSISSPQYPSNAKTIPCTFDGCKKFFNRQAKLTQHLRSHTDTRPFVCPFPPCTKAYLRDTHLQHHIKSAHSQIRDYVCTWEGCSKAFATGTRFRRHVAAHEGNTKTCTVDGCGQVFRKHSTLEVHIKKVHQGLKPYTCQYLNENATMCGMGFDSSAQLRSHEGRMHSRNTFECTICLPSEDGNNRRTFPTYGALQEHIRDEHPPTCDLCGLACASKSSLKSHIEVTHGGTAVEERKKFTCPQADCGRGFTKKGNMNAHIQSAHKNKRYICDSVSAADLNNVEGWDSSSACGDHFSTKANLEKHIRIVHMGYTTEARSHKQRRGSKAKSGPVAHESLTEEAFDEAMQCTVLGCSGTFLTNRDLASHLRTRHGLTDYEVRAMIPAVYDDEEAKFARPGFLGATAFATREDLDAEAAFDMQAQAGADRDVAMGGDDDDDTYDHDDHEDDIQHNQESFWLGGVSDEGAKRIRADEWHYDEQEMSRLIDDESYGNEDMRTEACQGGMDIDPMLL